MKTISIIIAIYNRKDELSELLTSLQNQIDKDFEVIIVDDGSQEDLKPTVENFTQNLEIQYVKKQNSGPGLSRNYGAERAKNNWLVFVDSDVIVEKNYIENIKKNLEKTNCAAFGGADKAHQDFNQLQKAISYSMTSVFTTGGIRGSKNAVTKFQPRSFNMGVNKEIFLKIGGFSEMRIGEDPDLSMRIWENGYQTAFFDDISVFHKRRTDLQKFAKQVYQFGCARPILNLRHPKYVKPTFWFPSLFLLGFLAAILEILVCKTPFILAGYLIYIFAILVHSTVQNKSIIIGLFSVISAFVQLFSYGFGFLESWVKLHILKQKPEVAFPKHFHQK